jgi:hypothetical protein
MHFFQNGVPYGKMDQPVNSSIVLFVMLGPTLLASGIFLFFRQRARIARSVKAEGVVIELIPRRASREFILVKTEGGVKLEKKYLYRPLVRFRTQDGRTIKFSPSIATRPAPYQVGDRVSILYEPDRPNQAQINRFVYLWFFPMMFIAFGVFTLGMGLLFYIIQ